MIKLSEREKQMLKEGKKYLDNDDLVGFVKMYYH